MTYNPIASLEAQAAGIELKDVLSGGQVGHACRQIELQLETIKITLEEAEAAAAKLRSPQYTNVFAEQELQRMGHACMNTAKQALTALHEAKTEASELEAFLEKKARPQKPVCDSIEAQLAGRKNDYKMLLDSLKPEAVAVALADLLHDAIADGDEVGAYLLCSDWSTLYLKSRGLKEDEFEGRMWAALENHGGTKTARQQLKFAKSKNGLAGLLTLTEHIVDMRLQNLRQELRI